MYICSECGNIYEKKCIGASDIASLVVRSGDKVSVLTFGKNDVYIAYIVDESCEIPNYYDMVYTGEEWLKIYDDDGLAFDATGERFFIYRSGAADCIIQIRNGYLNK